MSLISPKMKICSKCREEPPVGSFGRRSQSSDGLRPECRSCRSVDSKIYYLNLAPEVKSRREEAGANRKAERRAMANSRLVEGCKDCGETDPIVLEFDHVRGEKVSDISRIIVSGNIDSLREELDKCEVVCANCHRRRTAATFNWRIA